MSRAHERPHRRLLGRLAAGLAVAALTGVAAGQAIRVEDHVEVELRVAEPATAQEGVGELRVLRLGSTDADGWRERLLATDFDARERAFHELVVRGLKDRALFSSVLEWARSGAESDELAWTARLALREMRHRVQPARVVWVPRDGSTTGVEPLDLDAAAPDAPRGERELVETSPGDSLRSLDLRAPLEATQRASLYAPRVVAPRAVRRNVQFHFQPEGVTVVVSEVGPQGLRERRFAAEDVQTLLAEHPELRDFVPGIEDLPLRGGDGVARRAPRQAEAGGLEADARVLGVKVTSIPLQIAESRLLGPGVGLLIERREPGTLAEHFDLRRGDILVEVAGRPVCSPEEISRALAERDTLSFQVKIVDRNGIERVHRWDSSAAPKPSKPVATDDPPR